MLSANISDIPIITVKNIDFRFIIHIYNNLLKNSVLENCGYI